MNIVCFHQSMCGCGNGEPGNIYPCNSDGRIAFMFFCSLDFYSILYFYAVFYSLSSINSLFPIYSFYSYSLFIPEDHNFLSLHMHVKLYEADLRSHLMAHNRIYCNKDHGRFFNFKHRQQSLQCLKLQHQLMLLQLIHQWCKWSPQP